MTDNAAKPTKAPAKKRQTVAERLAAFKRSDSPEERKALKKAARSKAHQVAAIARTATRLKKTLEAVAEKAQQAAAQPVREESVTQSVPKSPLVMAVGHATSLMRRQKREAGHAAAIAAQLFDLDGSDVLQALQASLRMSAKAAEASEEVDDVDEPEDDNGFDDADWEDGESVGDL